MNYNKILSVDWNKLAIILTPIFWRKLRFISFIRVLISPIQALHSDFLGFRAKTTYRIQHNGQVGLLEKVLNDSYDQGNRRIYITDAVVNEAVYIYPDADNRPVYIYPDAANLPVYIYTDAVFNESEVDFIVHIPIELKPSGALELINYENKIKATVYTYRLFPKKFTIIYE